MPNTFTRRRFLQLGAAAMGTLAVSDRFLTQPAWGSSSSAFLWDSTKCVVCLACQRRCTEVNNLPEGESFISFDIKESDDLPVRVIYRKTCFQCQDAACVKVCPTGATTKGKNGLTYYDRQKCTGCGYCVEACPFSVPQLANGSLINQSGEWVKRCVSCTACAQACPIDALRVDSRDKVMAEAEARLANVKQQLPKAQLYGDPALNMIWVLADAPEVYGLPAEPKTDDLLVLWKEIVQPGGLLLSGAAVAGLSLTFLIARRNHLKEVAKEGGH